jgi:hypothetical protein
VMLVPRELDPVETGRSVPLPPERPTPNFFAQFGASASAAGNPAVSEPKSSAAQLKSKTRRVR